MKSKNSNNTLMTFRLMRMSGLKREFEKETKFQSIMIL